MKRWLVFLAIVLVVASFAPSGRAAVDVEKIARDEIREIQKRVTLPLFALIVIDYRDARGMAIHFARPEQYAIILLEDYRSENEIRGVVAHEVGHVYFYARGAVMDDEKHEEMADKFAVCFGTWRARLWAHVRWKAVASNNECESMRG